MRMIDADALDTRMHFCGLGERKDGADHGKEKI